MHKLIAGVCLIAVMAFANAQQSQPDNEFQKLPWVSAPASGVIADKATIKLGDNLLFLGEQGTSRFLELQGNPPRSGRYAIAPNVGDWFAVFSFTPSGHIKDDEAIDADALMEAMKAGDKESNEERKRLGMPALYLEGWHVRPHYDVVTKRLEWGTKLRDESGGYTINYSTRLLGRTGYMSVVLVSDPQTLDQDIKAFKSALAGFQYNSGERYDEFRAGDKVAEYGLAALVAGGAAAAAVKGGVGKGLFKMIGLAALAALAAGGAFFRRMFGRSKREDS